jgi:hypothetical protein
LRFLGFEGKVCQKFKEKVFYQGNLCYHGIVERIRLQEQKLWGIFPGQEALKVFYGLRRPRLLHNLGFWGSTTWGLMGRLPVAFEPLRNFDWVEEGNSLHFDKWYYATTHPGMYGWFSHPQSFG